MKWELKNVLFKHRLTVTGLAEHLGLARRTVSRWVNAEKFPGLDQDKLEAIAEYIGCPISEFLILDSEKEFVKSS